jgi:hypothetical protein
MSKPKASPIKASRRTFPVEVLWCGNLRQGSGKGWSFPPNVEKITYLTPLEGEQMKYEIDRNVLSAVHDERVFQNRKWGTITEHPHEVGGYLTLMRGICRWLSGGDQPQRASQKIISPA